MSEILPMQKVTFTLPAELTQRVREAVKDGAFSSQNALVREALQKELKRVREEWLEREFEKSSQDPLFLKDLNETMTAYKGADAETARMIVDV